MLFPTIEFALFFMIVFPLTWCLNNRNGLKKLFLLLVSYVFYSFWDWHFIFLLLYSAILNFVAGLSIERGKSARLRRLALLFAAVFNLLPLAYFKYFDFCATQLQVFVSLFGFTPDLGSTGMAVPVAISFLTFHGISYVFDVYRGRIAATRSPVDLSLYLSFFPHLVAGPIVRAADFLQQLAAPSDPERIEVARSLLLILGGLFKKVVIASHIATLYVDPIFTNPAGFSRLDLICGAYAYAIVIYCDFSAYTDIAIGVADLLGYKFPQNFNQPYRALSLRDFWSRWHITLSSWLRDYLYIPLGGNRRGRLKTYRNLVLTMLLGGLWHGAGLQFLAWGLLHGAGLAAQRFAEEAWALPGSRLRLWLRSAPGLALRWMLTVNFVCFAWIFFRSASISAALDYLKAIVSPQDAALPLTMTPFVASLILSGLLTQLASPALYTSLRHVFTASPLWLKVGYATAAIWATVLLAPDGIAPFIYFQF